MSAATESAACSEVRSRLMKAVLRLSDESSAPRAACVQEASGRHISWRERREARTCTMSKRTVDVQPSRLPCCSIQSAQLGSSRQSLGSVTRRRSPISSMGNAVAVVFYCCGSSCSLVILCHIMGSSCRQSVRTRGRKGKRAQSPQRHLRRLERSGRRGSMIAPPIRLNDALMPITTGYNKIRRESITVLYCENCW